VETVENLFNCTVWPGKLTDTVDTNCIFPRSGFVRPRVVISKSRKPPHDHIDQPRRMWRLQVTFHGTPLQC